MGQRLLFLWPWRGTARMTLGYKDGGLCVFSVSMSSSRERKPPWRESSS